MQHCCCCWACSTAAVPSHRCVGFDDCLCAAAGCIHGAQPAARLPGLLGAPGVLLLAAVHLMPDLLANMLLGTCCPEDAHLPADLSTVAFCQVSVVYLCTSTVYCLARLQDVACHSYCPLRCGQLLHQPDTTTCARRRHGCAQQRVLTDAHQTCRLASNCGRSHFSAERITIAQPVHHCTGALVTVASECC